MAKTRGRRRYKMRDEDQGQKRARRDLAGAERAVAALRTFYIVLAVLTALDSAVTLVMPAGGPGLMVKLVVLAIKAGSFAMLLMAVARVRQEPAAWSIIIAAFYSLGLLPGLMVGSVSIVGLAFVTILWCTVPSALKVNRLLKDFPELREVHAARTR